RFPDTEEVTGSIPVSRTRVYAVQSLFGCSVMVAQVLNRWRGTDHRSGDTARRITVRTAANPYSPEISVAQHQVVH
ncbi:MAG: hypothetical protein WCI78_05310, partial [Mycobacterium sp.]